MKTIQLSLTALILLLLSHYTAMSQHTVRGMVKDTSDIGYVKNISIVLITASDSVLQGFTRTEEDGAFSLSVKKEGRYMLLATHPDFATFIDEVEVKGDQTDLGTLPLTSKSDLLETVFFTDARAIMIKGDTTIYMADSFNVREYATVDELLKKLPGLEVSSDGKIKAYGKDVQKMYVDGEEFFSDDPAVVAKTLQASSIDRVKVYDDKSEEAKNTGIDDGERITTIDLTLKEHAKNGVMGKVEGGYGMPDNYHEFFGRIQAFKGKRKFAAYFNQSNTYNVGFGSEGTMYSFGGGRGGVVDMSERVSSISTDGLPNNTSAGANYTDKLWKDKLDMNFTYRFENSSLDRNSNAINRYILPDTQYVVESQTQDFSRNISHRLSTREQVAFDSMKSMNLYGGATFETSETNNKSISATKDLAGNQIRSSTTENTGNGDNFKSYMRIYYNQKLKKKGRSFNIGMNFNNTISNSESFLNSFNDLTAIDSTIGYNQRKITDNASTEVGFNGGYTEPLIDKLLFLKLNYKYSINRNDNDLKSYDSLANGNEVYNPLFSNAYAFNYNTHLGGIGIHLNRKNLEASVGLDASNIQFDQINTLHPEFSRKYANFNLMPQANIGYTLKSSTRIGLGYNGRTQQPTIDQIQPLVVNTDPTNIKIGNDNLVQSFSNNVSLYFNTYSVVKNYYAYVYANFNHVVNPINLAQNLDESGIRTYQYINTKPTTGASLTAYFGTQLVKGLRANVNFNMNNTRNYSFNNGLESENNTFSFNPEASLNYDLDTTLNLSVGYSPDFYNSTSSLRTDIENHYWTHASYFNVTYLLPYNFEIESRIRWEYRPQFSTNIAGNDVWMWTAGISKMFLKDRSLKLTLYCYDILNQNVGFNYYQSGYNTNESTWGVINRYVMLKVGWNFSTIKKKRKDQQETENLKELLK